jgi:hypothetical protein
MNLPKSKLLVIETIHKYLDDPMWLEKIQKESYGQSNKKINHSPFIKKNS